MILQFQSGIVDSARFRFVNKKTFQRGQIRSRNGNEPPNQCQGSDENRGHAQMRVWNTIDSTALACRIQFDSDKRVKWRRFLAPETFPPGTVSRSDRTMVATCRCNRFACCVSEIESSWNSSFPSS